VSILWAGQEEKDGASSGFGRGISFRHCLQIGFRAHSSSYLVVMGGKASGAWSWRFTSGFCRRI